MLRAAAANREIDEFKLGPLVDTACAGDGGRDRVRKGKGKIKLGAFGFPSFLLFLLSLGAHTHTQLLAASGADDRWARWCSRFLHLNMLSPILCFAFLFMPSLPSRSNWFFASLLLILSFLYIISSHLVRSLLLSPKARNYYSNV